MNTLFSAITAAGVLVLIIGGIYTYVKAKRIAQMLNTAIEDIFIPSNPGDPSLFSQTINEILEGGAQRVGGHVQAAIKGSIGGTMKGLNSALEKEAIEGDPTLALAGALPKSLRKNPIAMIGLQMLAGKMTGANNKNNSHNGEQAKFSL